MIWSGKKYPNESAICHMYKTDDCSLLKGLPSVRIASFKTRASSEGMPLKGMYVEGEVFSGQLIKIFETVNL